MVVGTLQQKTASWFGKNYLMMQNLQNTLLKRWKNWINSFHTILQAFLRKIILADFGLQRDIFIGNCILRRLYHWKVWKIRQIVETISPTFILCSGVLWLSYSKEKWGWFFRQLVLQLTQCCKRISIQFCWLFNDMAFLGVEGEYTILIEYM